jgi:hypothetical protein
MRWFMLLSALLALGLGTMRLVRADEPAVDPKAKQFRIQGRFTDIQVDGGEKAETVTRVPALYTVEGRRVLYRSGGAAGLAANAINGGVIAAPSGLSLVVTVTRAGSEDLLLDLAVENTQVDSKAIAAAKSVAVHSVRKAKLGKALRIILEEDAKGSPRQWLDLTVVEADE